MTPIKRDSCNEVGSSSLQVLDDDLETNGTEATIELNFAVLKFKHTIKMSLDQKKEDDDEA